MKYEVPARYRDMDKKAKAGSRKAAMRLKCLDCSCWVSKEVVACPCKDCALYPFRTGTFSKKG